MKLIFIILLLFLCSCSSLLNKAFATASGVEAVKIETSGGFTTGTILPNLILGGAVSAIATSPAVKDGLKVAPVVAVSKRNSFFGLIFGLDCSQLSLVYIGVPGLSSQDTANRIEAVKKILLKNKVDLRITSTKKEN